MKLLLSTEDEAPRDGFRLWREAIADRIVPISLERLDDRPFSGRLETADIGSLMVTRVSQGALRTELTPDMVRAGYKDGKISVGLALAGTGTALQDGRESIQRAGDISVLDYRPTVMSSGVGSRSLFLELPRERLEGILGSARLYTSLTVGSDQASTALAMRYFKELIRVHARLEPGTAERMVGIGIDLIVASIAERLAREVPRALHGTVVVQRAKAHVEANLGDPRLDPPLLAAAVGVSLRRLQELFQERGQHISDWIWHRRLETAARRLIDLNCIHLSIGMLAYGCGFSNQGHFSRRFKDRYGATPTEYREQAERTGLLPRLEGRR